MALKWTGQLEDRIVRAAGIGVLKGTMRVHREVIRLILRTRKSGRWYKRRGVRHRASAPGEAPASDLGNLVKNISTRAERDEQGRLTGTVVSAAKYARALEYGTKRMEARPYMRIALSNVRKEVEGDIAGEIAKVVK